MKSEWLNEKEQFNEIDVRKLKGNFLPGLLKKAQNMEIGEGICVIQSFEPIPLYSALEEMGFEYDTEHVLDAEYRIYFYRISKETPTYPEGLDIPLKPTAIVNFNAIDSQLANVVVPFWELIWGQENPSIDMKTRLLLSLSNGVGAGRMRQTIRELIKAYSVGVTVAEFDELFSMFVWNQGVGHFASEIGPSALFAAYQLIKTQEANGKNRGEIVKELMDRFGEKNPAVGTFYKAPKGE